MPARRYVYAKETCMVVWRGVKTRIKRGQVWSSDDPMVRKFGSLFQSEPIVVHDTRGRPVEDATAEPGAKRAIT